MELTQAQAIEMIKESTAVDSWKEEHKKLLAAIEKNDLEWFDFHVSPEGKWPNGTVIPECVRIYAWDGLTRHYVVMDIATKVVRLTDTTYWTVVDYDLLERMKAAVKRDAPDFADRDAQRYIWELVRDGVDIGTRVPAWLRDPFEYVE